MLVPYSWLKEFVDFDLTSSELGHRLTMAGFELEAEELTATETVLDIGVTPNRPDCLSIRGMAREASAILKLPFKDLSVSVKGEAGQGPSITIEENTLCPRYAARTITGVRNGSSPKWLTDKLEACGVRPVSLIVDITNYVLMEMGQPLHAFDLDRLSGGRIVVKQAGDTKEFFALDGTKTVLEPDMLLIWDDEKPVALAGVMGGANSEVSDNTVNILLESAYFFPASIRKTSRLTGLASESSFRFARGTDIGALDLALDRAATLIVELAGGEVSTITDIYPLPVQTREIEVTFEKINSIIGVNIEQSFVENTLISLGLDTRRKIDTSRSLEDTLIIIPPSFRNDIQTDIDIVEEVARLYGYDNIPSTLPSVHMSPAPEHELYKQIKTMKNSMVMSGFYEAVNFSFMNPNMLDQLLLRKEDHRRSFISIKNPLRQEDSAMRTTLVPTLLQNLSLNLNRGEKMLRFFEVARTYTDTGDKLPVERTELTAILHKDKSAALWEARNVGYYDLKGVLENLLRVINLHGVEFVPSCDKTEPYLHPGKTAIIRVNDENIGTIGVLHPGVAVAFDLKGDITVAEIWDLNKLLEYTAAIPEYRTIPRFPYIERDIALVVSDSVTAADVKREVLTSGSDIIESVSLFDIYKGKPLPADKKSLAFAVRYRSTSDTLKDSDVEEVHGSIISRLQKNLGAELRS